MSFHYYGSKNLLAKRYPYPLYDTIVEPFAGSAAYSLFHLNLKPSLKCILCEKDMNVYNAWMWLKSHTEEDALNYPCPNTGDVTYDFFVKMSSASNAALKCKKMTVTKRMAKVFPTMMKRIASNMKYMNNITVINGSYECLDNIEATWFIDPPYQSIGNSVNGNGYGKGCCAKDIDFSSLGEWCLQRKGQVIVCEKEGANWLPFELFHTATNSLDRKYNEVIFAQMGTREFKLSNVFHCINQFY